MMTLIWLGIVFLMLCWAGASKDHDYLYLGLLWFALPPFLHNTFVSGFIMALLVAGTVGVFAVKAFFPVRRF